MICSVSAAGYCMLVVQFYSASWSRLASLSAEKENHLNPQVIEAPMHDNSVRLFWHVAKKRL